MPAAIFEWLKTTNGDEFMDDTGLVWKFAGTQIVDPEYDGKDKNAVLFKFDVTNNCLKLKDFDFFAVRRATMRKSHLRRSEGLWNS